MAAKRVIVFVLSLALAIACAFELYSGIRNFVAHPVRRISASEFRGDRSFEQWFVRGRSRHREKVTIGTVNGQQALIIGDTTRGGWILPVVRPDNYRSEVRGVDLSIPVFHVYRLHPAVAYSLGAAACGLLLAVSVFLCIGCIRMETI